MADRQTPSTDLVASLSERTSLIATLQNPDMTLARAAATYIMFKRKRLTPASERGYQSALDELTKNHPGARLRDFEPPAGTLIVEDFLTARWGDKAPRTYNKALSIYNDFFSWHVARGTLARDPMGTIERAKARQIYRRTFSDTECQQIFDANQEPAEQIALRLLLHYAIRKGALRGVRFEHFNREKRELTVFTKGEKFHVVQVVEEEIWRLLDEIDAPGHHYLIPRQKTRKRIAPQRKALGRLEAALGDASLAFGEAAKDEVCARDLARLLDALALTDVCLQRVVDTATTQTRFWPGEPIGEHGMHLLWYRWLVRAGIVEPGTTAGRRMHFARHSAIQRVLNKTGNLKAAQAVAGHATLSTTGNDYTEWTPEQTAKTMREVLA